MPTAKPESPKCCVPRHDFWDAICDFSIGFPSFLSNFKEKCGAAAGDPEWDDELAAWRLLMIMDGGGQGVH